MRYFTDIAFISDFKNSTNIYNIFNRISRIQKNHFKEVAFIISSQLNILELIITRELSNFPKYYTILFISMIFPVQIMPRYLQAFHARKNPVFMFSRKTFVYALYHMINPHMCNIISYGKRVLKKMNRLPFLSCIS